MTYDYSSFTTSLAELKYFLTYLARQLEDITFRALDVFEGIVEINLGEYIQQYNETINHNAEYDVSRLDLCELSFILWQTRSGMLGAQGNIGFATLLHGLSISGVSDQPHSNCVVGDDAMLRTWATLIALAIARVNVLGSIEASKFHIWETPDMYSLSGQDDYDLQQWQFLKRPTNVDGTGKITTGRLPVFPNLAEILLEPDRFHVTYGRETDPFKQFIRFAKEWGRFITRLNLESVEVNHDEVDLILIPIRAVYQRFNVPQTGLPIGAYLECTPKSYGNVPIIIPPCTARVFDEDWIDLHCEYYTGTTVTLPVLVDYSIPPGPCYGPGHVIEQCTLHRIQRVMVDLGYMEATIVNRSLVLSQETIQDVRDLISGYYTRIVHRLVCIKEPPEWYNTIIYDEGPE
jgi:hypothetical protein